MADATANVRITATDDASGVVTSFSDSLEGLERNAVDAGGSLSETSEEIKKTGDEAEDAGGKTSRFSGILGTLGTIAEVAAAAVVGTAAALANFASAAGESEKITLRLQNAFRSYGDSANAVAANLLEFARVQSDLVAVDDEVIASGIAKIAAFTQNEDAIKAATKAALDFAAATGTDVESAFSIFAKAAEGNVTALVRLGLVVDENATKSQKFAAAVRFVNENMGGQAQAQAAGYSGTIDRLGIAFGNTAESLGKFIIQNDTVKASIAGVTTALNETSKSLDAFAAGGVTLAEHQIQGLKDSIEELERVGGNPALIQQLRDRLAEMTETVAPASEGLANLREKLRALQEQIDASNLQAANAEFAQFAEQVSNADSLLASLGVTSEHVAQESISQLEEKQKQLKAALDAGAISFADYSAGLAAIQAQLGQIPGSMQSVADAARALGDELAAEGARRQAEFDKEDAIRDKIEATTEALFEQADAASAAATGWIEFTAARSSDPRTDVQIAQANLDAVKLLGPFATTIDGRGSLGAQQDAERALAAARARETNGGNAAGSTAPLTISPAGRVAGGNRTLDVTGQVR